MPKYNLVMTFEYEIETDDIENVLSEFEFPVFNLDEDKVEFIHNVNQINLRKEISHA